MAAAVVAQVAGATTVQSSTLRPVPLASANLQVPSARRRATSTASASLVRPTTCSLPNLTAVARKVHIHSRKVCCSAAMAEAAPAPATDKSISGTFQRLKEKGQCALIPFICAGDPDLETTKKALLALDAAGADIIELGVPYSDPLADGPVIQAAATRALAKGTTLVNVLDMLKEISPSLKAPVVLFTYFNPIMKLGAETFIKEIKARGASGLVVPDIPLEETGFLREITTANGIELILLATPTTPQSRMADIAAASQGFVYLVSVTGVTGVRAKVENRVEGLLQLLKSVTTKPIGVGFGISSPEDALRVRGWGADGVIAGSAFVRLLGEAASPEEGVAAVAKLAASLKQAISS